MNQAGEKDREIREALIALISDIEGLYEGEDVSDGQLEEFFGPFSVGKIAGVGPATDVSVSWPNLAISLRNAKAALQENVEC